MLHNMLVDPMHRAANRVAQVWDDRTALDTELQDSMRKVPYVAYLYALETSGVQISANASEDGLMPEDLGRDRSTRPYFQQIDPELDMTLSEAYISLRANRPSVTALQKVWQDGEHIGWLGADFDLRKLPITKDMYSDPSRWRQIKGDPAIRGQVFQQTRIPSRLDRHINQILPVVEELITDNGIFHLKLHFSSSRATVWTLDDPYRYQVIEFEDLVDPDICLAFPHRDYPADAVVPKESIKPIFETFRQLRFADETIYLRAGSINIFNGIVGLNFSCDGSHYIPFDQFLAKDSEFWEGM
nr:PDC sensor domain-containing protein [endosymbiont of unidentified scaly snail isolate Monju]